MEESLLKEQGLQIGDDVMLTLYYYRCALEGSEVFIEPLITDTYKIVGSMQPGAYQGNWMPPEIIWPLDCIREAYHRQGLEFLRIPDPLW